jgi:hypothetical protein
MAGGGGDGDVDHGRFWREPMDTTLAAVSPRRRGRRKLNDLGLHSRAIGCAFGTTCSSPSATIPEKMQLFVI